jgi:hypothetical protein
MLQKISHTYKQNESFSIFDKLEIVSQSFAFKFLFSICLSISSPLVWAKAATAAAVL